ncbi:decapping endonuclease targeting mRNA [Polyrhizophydium stewartii]|uniref:Extracellular metalloproteinase n=1 Tax=Polyrhizophydium stewartii TaxID=2732419 RepID=A0ABR4N6N6_9FUNG|nr:hypothetical protein HK105_001986 [Polyrhizophydium stewartii]
MRASFSLALALAAAATPAFAAPTPASALQRRAGGKLPFYFPESVYEIVPSSGSASLQPVPEDQAVKIATDFLVAKLGLAAGEFQVANSFTDASGTTHVYGTQVVNGARVANHHAAAHVQNGEVVSFSSSFNTGSTPSSARPRIPPVYVTVPAEDAIAKAVKDSGIPHLTDVEAVSEYVNTGSGIVYAHKFQLRDDASGQWVQVWVDANTGGIVLSADFVKKLTYRAVELPKANVLQGLTLIADPENAAASPNGWVDDSQSTRGNNANVYHSQGGNLANEPSADGVFNSAWNPEDQPTTSDNLRAATVNLFYIANVMHDISYQYGFTEKAGNFQLDNFGEGGKANDAVVISVQDASGTNNANFATPPDGQAPRMNMYRFTYTTPNRDGSLENPIPMHEYTHGISDRLTGGSATGVCLVVTEAGGMGEGWSDFVALVLTAKPTDTSATLRVIGNYVVRLAAGFRTHPYSIDMSVNPLKYSDLDNRIEVHAIGEVWVEMLWEVYWNLVNKYGFNANMYDAKSTAGNIVALQLVIGGMMNQPCNPNFVQARDAILTADRTFYGGKYMCDIWKGFAKRGLGKSATTTKTDKFDVPSGC